MIPLSVPSIRGNEWKYVKECLDTEWVSSVGSYVDLFEEKIAEYTGARFAISTVNGTAALHTALILAGVERDDFVIIPNLTFAATANAIRYQGADPLMCDVLPGTWQLDVDLLERWLESHTHYDGTVLRHSESGRRIQAIMPVHVLGNMADMDQLMTLAKRVELTVIEDAAEGLGSYYKGRHAGTIGELGALSFNGNKIMTTGGGGMLLTNDEALAARARHITRQAKTDPLEYDHDEVGYNYRMVNVLAAMGVAQLEMMETFLHEKQHIANIYTDAFKEVSSIFPQQKTDGVKANNWLYTIMCHQSRDLMKHLALNKIQTRPLWRPMNQLPMYKDLPYISEKDISRQLNDSCLSIPCSTNLKPEDQQEVIRQIQQFYR